MLKPTDSIDIHDTDSRSVLLSVVPQADPSGPNFQTLFENTEQTLKVGGGAEESSETCLSDLGHMSGFLHSRFHQ